MGRGALKVGGRIAGEARGDVWLGGCQAGLGAVVDEQPPHLLERDDADELLDIDPR